MGGAWIRALGTAIRGAAADAADAMFDRRCPGCGGPLDRGSLVCDACDAVIPRTGATLCLRCLRGDPPADSDRRVCVLHGAERLVLAGPRFEPPLDSILHAYKYDGARHLAAWIASLIPEPPGRGGSLGKEYILVPVPLHPARLAQRGFDQCAILAGQVSGRWGIPVVPALVRVRDGTPQARRPGSARRANLEGVFRLKLPSLVEGRAVLLLDDVATTGSTLLAAAAGLEEAGPTWILALSAAHAAAQVWPESAQDAEVAGRKRAVIKYHARQKGAGVREPWA
jgi:ComF family protein